MVYYLGNLGVIDSSSRYLEIHVIKSILSTTITDKLKTL